MSKLTATPAQRKNIRLLLSYLSAILPTDMANEYNHESFASCTVGYAIRSDLFPELVKNTKPVRVIDYALADGSKYDEIDSLFEAVFGVDYTHGIIYSADLDDVYDVDAGRKQLEYVIKSIRKLFNLKELAFTWWSVVRSALVGFGVGVLPGAGASVAAEKATSDRDKASARVFMMSSRPDGRSRPDCVLLSDRNRPRGPPGRCRGSTRWPRSRRRCTFPSPLRWWWCCRTWRRHWRCCRRP